MYLYMYYYFFTFLFLSTVVVIVIVVVIGGVIVIVAGESDFKSTIIRINIDNSKIVFINNRIKKSLLLLLLLQPFVDVNAAAEKNKGCSCCRACCFS
mmetsp:Transcript_28094/g.31576  ORF Transcript_28094/g.31576 Transcript_28094/m.31576 type:complete len:97 (-) Transcript_28094:35-325(-)